MSTICRMLASALLAGAAGSAAIAGPAEPSAVVPPGVAAYAAYLGGAESITVFEGDFTGDGADDAVAFIYYANPGGNALFLDFSLFESIGGELVHRRVVDEVFGMGASDVHISPGRIEVTMTVLKPGEPRCCPTGEKRYTIKP